MKWDAKTESVMDMFPFYKLMQISVRYKFVIKGQKLQIKDKDQIAKE